MPYLIFFCIIVVGVRYAIIIFASYALFMTVLPNILETYLQPQHNALNSLGVLSLLRPRLILRFLHLSPIIAGIRGAAGGISPPRRSPPGT